jgi:hypothetical protein
MGLPSREDLGDDPSAADLLQFCWQTKSLAVGQDGLSLSKQWEADCSSSLMVFVAALVVAGTTVLLVFLRLCACGKGGGDGLVVEGGGAAAGTKAKKKKNKKKKAAGTTDAPAPAAAPAAAAAGSKKNKKKKNAAAAQPEVQDDDDEAAEAQETAEERYEREDAEHAAAMKAQFAAAANTGGAAGGGGKSKKKKKGGGGDGGGSGGGGGGSGLTKQQQADMDAGWEVEGAKKKKTGGKKKGSQASPNADPNAEIKDSITVEARKMGIIIGPKGATLQGVQAATNTKIDTPQRDREDRSPAKVMVSGRADDVKRAIAALKELCDKGYTTVTQDKGFTEQSVAVHPSVLSELIGPGGSIIRAIQDKLEVKITIPDTDWRPGRQVVKAKPAKVGVAGSKEACVQAKACITSIARYHHHEVTHPGMTHKEVDVPPEYLNFVRAAPRSSLSV